MQWATFSPSDSLNNSLTRSPVYPFVGGYDGVAKIESVGKNVSDLKVIKNLVI
jgi:NADPH:quinone reductase-like Zn-dependent oxidoreductase